MHQAYRASPLNLLPMPRLPLRYSINCYRFHTLACFMLSSTTNSPPPSGSTDRAVRGCPRPLLLRWSVSSARGGHGCFDRSAVAYNKPICRAAARKIANPGNASAARLCQPSERFTRKIEDVCPPIQTVFPQARIQVYRRRHWHPPDASALQPRPLNAARERGRRPPPPAQLPTKTNGCPAAPRSCRQTRA